MPHYANKFLAMISTTAVLAVTGYPCTSLGTPKRVPLPRPRPTATLTRVSMTESAVSRPSPVLAMAETTAASPTDLGAVRQALDLVKKLNVTPEDNDTSKTLSKNAADKLAELGKLNGAAFDKAYIANEVAYHKAVNSALETTLIPSASNAELKSLLQTGLKIFQGHQQHAEHVAAELK